MNTALLYPSDNIGNYVITTKFLTTICSNVENSCLNPTVFKASYSMLIVSLKRHFSSKYLFTLNTAFCMQVMIVIDLIVSLKLYFYSQVFKQFEYNTVETEWRHHVKFSLE